MARPKKQTKEGEYELPQSGRTLGLYYREMRAAERKVLLRYLMREELASQAARILGITTKTLLKRCKMVGIELDSKPGTGSWLKNPGQYQPEIPSWMIQNNKGG